MMAKLRSIHIKTQGRVFVQDIYLNTEKWKLFFSNSLIIRDENTKKITIVK